MSLDRKSKAEIIARLDGRVFRAPATIEREWEEPDSLSHMVLLRFDEIDQLESKKSRPPNTKRSMTD